MRKLLFLALVLAGCSAKAPVADAPRAPKHIFGAAIGGTNRSPLMGGSGSSHTSGLAPDPGASAGTTRFLREDATWAVPPSGSSSLGLQTANVLSFGADATGVADSTAAIQSAIDSVVDATALANGGVNPTNKYGVCYLPSGNYTTSKPIWLDGDGVSVRGENVNGANLTCIDGGLAIVMGHRRRADWDRTLRSDEPVNACGGSGVTFTNGSATVVGSGTDFNLYFANFLTGAPLYIKDAAGSWARIQSVNSATQLTLTAPYSGTSVISTAVHRGCDFTANLPVQFAADHRVDAWNGGTGQKLDLSVCSGPSSKWGVRSFSVSGGSPFADHWISWPLSGPGLGVGWDCWDTIRSLTLDLNIEPRFQGAINTDLMGFGSGSAPAPWWLSGKGGVYTFSFLTKEGVRDSSNTARTFSFGNTATASGVQRIAIQIDYTKNTDGSTGTAALCSIRAWINGAEQTITRGYGTQLLTATGTEPSFTAGDGLHWQSAEPGAVFSIFNASSSNLQWDYGSVYTSARLVATVYGLRMSNATRYTTIGGVQARADNSALYSTDNSTTCNDAYRYIYSVDTASLICALDTTFPATADYPGRLVPMRMGPAMGGVTHHGLFLYQKGGETLGGYVVDNTVSDMTIKGSANGGAVIQVGACLNPSFADLDLNCNSSAIGIGGVVASVYYAHADRITFQNSAIAWIYATGWILKIDTIEGATGRFALRFDGCSVRCHDASLGDANNTECFVKITGNGGYGSQYEFDIIDSDNEGLALPWNAFLYCERHGASFTQLTVKRINPGTLPRWVPTIKLVDRYPLDETGTTGPGPGYVKIDDTVAGRIGITTDGPGWTGDVDHVPQLRSGGNLWRLHTGTDGASNVVAHQRLDGLPTGGAWQKNAQIIDIRHPGAGATQRYVVSTSGVATWNSATLYKGQFRDLVYSGGNIYEAVGDSTNSVPPSSFWTQITAWSSTTSYPAGNRAISGGSVWMATATNTNSLPSATNPNWIFEAPAVQAMFAPVNTLGTPVAQ